MDKVRQWPFLAVMGPSGSGKSSVVRAGLIPALKGGALPGSKRWLYATTFKPGARPLDALAVAVAGLQTENQLGRRSELRQLLATDSHTLLVAADLLLAGHPDKRLMLIIDQAEEVITLAPADKAAREHHEQTQTRPFIRQLLATVSANQTQVCVGHSAVRISASYTRIRCVSSLGRQHDVIVTAMTREGTGLGHRRTRPYRQAAISSGGWSTNWRRRWRAIQGRCPCWNTSWTACGNSETRKEP